MDNIRDEFSPSINQRHTQSTDLTNARPSLEGFITMA